MRELYVDIGVKVATEPAPPVSGNLLVRHDLDDLALVELTSSRCSASRTRRMARRDTADMLALIIVRSGRERISVGDEQLALGPGDAAVWDLREPARFEVLEPVEKWNLLIPREVAASVVGPRERAVGPVVQSPGLRVLRTFLGHLATSLHEIDGLQAVAIRNATVELLPGALAPGTAHHSPRAELRAIIDQWLVKNLRADLSPVSIATAHAISVRTLHRLYESDGDSVGRFIQHRRLERARDDVLHTNDPLSTIAHRWGFADASHFARRYLERYAESASEGRRNAQRQSDVFHESSSPT